MPQDRRSATNLKQNTKMAFLVKVVDGQNY